MLKGKEGRKQVGEFIKYWLKILILIDVYL